MPRHLIDTDITGHLTGADVRGELPAQGQLAVVTATAATTIADAAAQTLVLADATAATFAVTLPAVAVGQLVTVKKIDGSVNAVTVATPGTETIDGAADASLAAQYDVIRLVSDGANWFVI